MVKERRIKEFQRMHKELMDPEERVKAKREADKQKVTLVFYKMFSLIKNLFKKERSLTYQELKDIQALNNLCVTERFKAQQIRSNTAMFKNGQTFAAQQEALVNLLEGVKEQIIAKKLTELGYPQNQKVAINLVTGKITKVEEPAVREVAVPAMPKK